MINDCSQKHVSHRATVCLHRDNMAEVQSVVGQAVRVIDAQVRGLLFYYDGSVCAGLNYEEACLQYKGRVADPAAEINQGRGSRRPKGKGVTTTGGFFPAPPPKKKRF